MNTRLPLSERLTVMVDPVTMNALGKLAADKRESMSNIVRRTLLTALPQFYPEFKELMKQSFDEYFSQKETQDA